MSSSLPTESAADESVDTFGMGTYDSPESGNAKGGDANQPARKRSLPEDGGPFDPFGPDRLLSYPQMTASTRKKSPKATSTAMLPADYDYPSQSMRPPRSHYDKVVPSTSEQSSELPSGDHDSHMMDYADRFSIGFSTDTFWSSGESDTYASDSRDSIPSVVDNDANTSNGLGALGNPASGYVVEDQNVPKGFPSEDFLENSSYKKSAPGNLVASRIATNIELVRDLTEKFLKKMGRSDLTKRHVLSFLSSTGYYSFLSSDVIRCLKMDHDIHVKDVLDLFPVRKASVSLNPQSLVLLRDFCVLNEMNNHHTPEVASLYREAAASLSVALASIERVEG